VAGKPGVVKIRLSAAQKKALGNAKKASLVVRYTLLSGGKSVAKKRTYKVRLPKH
jgi:hypothetical protein